MTVGNVFLSVGAASLDKVCAGDNVSGSGL